MMFYTLAQKVIYLANFKYNLTPIFKLRLCKTYQEILILTPTTTEFYTIEVYDVASHNNYVKEFILLTATRLPEIKTIIL